MGTQLYVRDDKGAFAAAESELIVRAAQEVLRRRMRRGATLSSPSLVRAFLAVTLGDRDCEYFCVILLDGRHRLLKFVELFRGTIDGASVHPREVVKLALEVGAGAIIAVHNHPSAVGEPSRADEIVTQRLRDALSLVDVRLIDHLIVAGDEVVSLAERGVL